MADKIYDILWAVVIVACVLAPIALVVVIAGALTFGGFW